MAQAKQTAKETAILQSLSELGGSQMKQDDGLRFEGDKFTLPKSFEGKPISKAVRFLEDWAEQQTQTFAIRRSFDYHPYDTANAFQRVLQELFGTSGFGVATPGGFFSPDEPPEYRTVKTGPSSTTQVPWGRVMLPMLGATFVIGYTKDRHGQPVGEIIVELPKKFRSQIEGLFKAIEADLAAHSLYRGKALDANWLDPEFLNLSGVREDQVAYSRETRRQIEANVWTVLEHDDVIVANGMSLKRAVLLEGPYGTGKSLTGYLTARKAVEHGWTFIYCKPGQNLDQALHAARLLAPAVVFFEDLDVVAEPDGSSSERDRISKMLDTFDGMANKSTPVVAVLTTNHVERLHKGMLRPGRLDAVIHIGFLDGEGVRTLVQTVIPEELRGTIDYEAVAEATKEFLPAFIKEAAERALRYSIARTKGNPDKINTDDLVSAAEGLRPQLDLMTGAKEAGEVAQLEQAFGALVNNGLDGALVVNPHDDDRVAYKLRPPQPLDAK